MEEISFEDINPIQIIRTLVFTDTGNLTIIGKLIAIVATIFLASLAMKIVKSLVLNRLKLPNQVEESKVNTMQSLIYNLLKVLIIFLASINILELLGVNTNSILATAGIGGVAIGFGAQYIIRDYISGMVIMAEDQYRVGELITIEGLEGYVEEVSLRLTKLRAFNGNLHIIQNGNITKVTNQSRGPQRVWTEIYVDKSIPSTRVEKALVNATEIINGKWEEIVEPITYLGINNMTEFDAVYLLKGMVEPEYQWAIDRDMRRLALEELAKLGIDTSNMAAEKMDFSGADDRQVAENLAKQRDQEEKKEAGGDKDQAGEEG